MRSGNMPKSLFQNWQFAIEVNGFDVALFHKGQEPKTEFEEVAFAPAGSMFDQKVAGRVKFDDITLEKGVLQDGSDAAIRGWIKKQVDVNAGTGGLPADYMRDIDIVRYDRTGSETRRWTLKVTLSGQALSIPLSIRGNPRGEIQYEVVADSIVWVDWQGRVWFGERAGATMIMVYDSPMRDSVRYVQVEVLEESGGGYIP